MQEDQPCRVRSIMELMTMFDRPEIRGKILRKLVQRIFDQSINEIICNGAVT